MEMATPTVSYKSKFKCQLVERKVRNTCKREQLSTDQKDWRVERECLVLEGNMETRQLYLRAHSQKSRGLTSNLLP